MTRYDYKYQKQRQARILRPQRMKKISRIAFINIVLGFVIGTSCSLYYTWEVSPVKLVDNEPYALHDDYADEYLLLIAQKYALEKDLDVALLYLSDLQLDDPGKFVSNRTEYMINSGYSQFDIKAMVALADALGTLTAQMRPFLS